MHIKRISTVSNGKTYNAYLIKGKKTALVDSAPEECGEELMHELGNVDYLIFTHTDRARAGAVDALTKKYPGAIVVASIAGLRNIKEITNRPVNELAAKDGMVVDLGGISLEVLITPNLSWPDTIMLYIKEEMALLSGTMFVRSEEYYHREIELFCDFAQTAVERASELDIKTVYPSEGEISDAGIIEKYRSLTELKRNTKQAAIIYAGHENGYTLQMARVVEETMLENGIDVCAVSCKSKNAADIMNSAEILCFASPTIHRRAVPEIMDVISRLDRVNKVRTPCMVIGSYGWGGEALGFMAGYLKMLKMRVFDKPFGVIMKPSEEQKRELKKFTERFLVASEEIYDNK